MDATGTAPHIQHPREFMRPSWASCPRRGVGQHRPAVRDQAASCDVLDRGDLAYEAEKGPDVAEAGPRLDGQQAWTVLTGARVDLEHRPAFTGPLTGEELTEPGMDHLVGDRGPRQGRRRSPVPNAKSR
jgi:hypothetical protein